jgi:hypothetical protein
LIFMSMARDFGPCELPGGKKVEVRHCIDFFTTIAAMENDLGPRRIEEMISFVTRELWTPEWLYALSPRDRAAGESTRPDHGSTGAYDAWPSLTAEAFFKTGRKVEALERLRSVESATVKVHSVRLITLPPRLIRCEKPWTCRIISRALREPLRK